ISGESRSAGIALTYWLGAIPDAKPPRTFAGIALERSARASARGSCFRFLRSRIFFKRTGIRFA
ncbi:hypothetical protein V5F38_06215, partial [Xanthobacter sp. V0B-10]